MDASTRDKFDRGAVEELEYDEITDVFELLHERVRNRTDDCRRLASSTAERVRGMSDSGDDR